MPDGVLNIDKPAGWTSHDVVAKIRRILGTRRAGHAGTLDPDATGVLVVAVGQATRILPFLPTEPKEYVARLTLGIATTTEDASGEVTTRADAAHVDEAALRALLPRFTGRIEQIPPMVSAVHHEGRRLYELAREGIVVERAPRSVAIHALTLADFLPGEHPEATLQITCGGGTYIRTLCADIGAALGVGGHMKALVRDAVGIFRRDDAVSLRDLEDAPGAAPLLPMERALGLPTLALTAPESDRVGQGMTLAPARGAELPDGAETVALLYGGRLRALARRQEEDLHPFKVFPATASDGRGDGP